MMVSVHLRQATAADAPACTAIEHTVFLPSEAATREQIEVRLAQFPQGFFVADTKMEIVGFITTGNTTTEDISDEALKAMIGHEPTGANVVIFSVAVLPAWQGLGIAMQLIHAIVGAARQRQKRAVLLLCKEHLIAFYEHFGFENAGASPSTHGGVHWQQMRLPLVQA
jgi:ribosomal protein S18 acetylase RimI-like enzyme